VGGSASGGTEGGIGGFGILVKREITFGTECEGAGAS